MWLKRLVGSVMIIVFVGLNTMVLIGLFKPRHTHLPIVTTEKAPATVIISAPTVSLSVNPAAIATGTPSALIWTTTGSPDTCTASGNWNGTKTILGAESTGRLNTPGKYTYTLTCTNKSGSAQASADITVSASPPPASHSATSTSPTSNSTITVTYCNGRSPCYGKREIAAHGSSGNCWGWNIDRVVDISGFDAGYHETKSGISSIQIGSICGKDLAPSLSGNVSAEGQTRVHNSSTRNNADANEIPYFVGYFDANKP